MMTRPVILPDFYYEYATAQMLGRRDCQEDAVLGSFALGSDFGFVVLADGMGGHAAGDIASRIVVTEVFSELMFRAADVDAIGSALPDVLRAAADLDGTMGNSPQLPAWARVVDAGKRNSGKSRKRNRFFIGRL